MASTDSYSNRHAPRSSSDRVFAGVCGGLAEHIDVSSTWLRIGMVAATVMTSGIAAFFYIACIFIMPRGDGQPSRRRSRRQKTASRPFYRSREEAMVDLNDQFNTIERRIRNLEDLVTSREYVLKRKFEEL